MEFRLPMCDICGSVISKEDARNMHFKSPLMSGNLYLAVISDGELEHSIGVCKKCRAALQATIDRLGATEN